MKNVVFDFHKFSRTLLIFFGLTTVWTLLCLKTDEFTSHDKGLLSGAGFLVVFSLAFYLGQKPKSLKIFIYLLAATIGIFLTSSFVLGPLIIYINNSLLLYTILASVFVSISLTLTLKKLYRIDFVPVTIILTIILFLISHLLVFKISDQLNLEYNISPRITMFNIVNFFLTVALSFGLSVKRSGA